MSRSNGPRRGSHGLSVCPSRDVVLGRITQVQFRGEVCCTERERRTEEAEIDTERERESGANIPGSQGRKLLWREYLASVADDGGLVRRLMVAPQV
jgi:hypothetical protein